MTARSSASERPDVVVVDGDLAVADVAAVAYDGARVELADAARDRMAESEAVVEDVTDANEESVYGVNTGFGNLKDIAIAREDLETQQHNLLRSHHAATGDPLDVAATRASILVRANALAVGVSGVSPDLVERLLALLNAGVHPVIPESGSADNACELANVGLVLAGGPAGEAILASDATIDGGDGERISYADAPSGEHVGSETALEEANLDPYAFGPKEGLSLISGTSVATALAALAIADLRNLVATADLAGAWTFALVGKEPGAFDDRIFDVRDVDGHRETAANVRDLTGADAPDRADMTQDPLSIRTIPQVNGSLREHLRSASETVETELASATDNPLVFPDGTARSVGHFNAQHVAGVADLLALTTTKVGAASERRSDLLLAEAANPHLATDPGLETGLARAQYAAASLVTEAQGLDTASDRSFVASTGQEDVHAAGNLAGKHLRETVDLIARVVAVELLCAARATAQTATDLPGPLDAAYTTVEELVGVDPGDVTWSEKTEAVGIAARNGTFVDAVTATGVDLR